MCRNRQGFSCSFFSLERSQISTFLPQPQAARMLEVNGLHSTFITLFFYPESVDSALVRFLKSQTDTFSSADPEANRNSLKGEKSNEYISSVCATISKMGFLSQLLPALLKRVSQMLMSLSSEQLAKILEWNLCHATSSIGALWCSISKMGWIRPFYCLFFWMSQMHIRLSEKPDSSRFLSMLFQLRPQPYPVWLTNFPTGSLRVVRVISPLPVAIAMILGSAGQQRARLISPECCIFSTTVILCPFFWKYDSALFQLGQSILILRSWHCSGSALLEAMMAKQLVWSSWISDSGSHWKVQVGQSMECRRRKSQRSGDSFFQILYS